MIRDDATQRQVDAAEPAQSTWLAANAGSGKTRVLTDRVARLLLDGVQPENILCLTYTKAAATEMQNRLFKRLGEWAMLNAAALRAALRGLGVDTDQSDDFLAQARTLFARAIEAPGGLRIQTIHSFCSSLLRRFPLEAGVTPQFKEMEDRAAALLRMDILDRMSDGEQAELVAAIAPFVSGDDSDALLRDIVSNRDGFQPALQADQIFDAYNVPKGFDDAALLGSVFLGGELSMFAQMVPALAGSGPSDQKLGAVLHGIAGADMPALLALEAIVLTGSGAKQPFAAKVGSIPTKGLRTGALAEQMPAFEALMGRVEDARARRLGLAAATRDVALHRFAAAFLTRYEAEKQTRGLLDFDDLIDRARRLLSDPSVAEWVLYRLDGGIDHILVDEAQDTAPKQWQVIERLAQEFTSGQGARDDMRRTIFVVGDKKQSIYSFQGADPSEFDRMRAEFADRFAATGAPLVSLSLAHSFRSAEPILRLVDNTFPGGDAAGFSADLAHLAFHETMPGRVDLWPLVAKNDKEDDGAWYDPQDRIGSRHHTVILANRVAAFIRDTLRARTPLPDLQDGAWRARPVRAGDFLILVRSRNRLFEEIIRACKQAGLPLAGADRLKVMAELAVRDIIALLRFLATQEDDMSLASALRSPLFGLSEQDLFDLAHGRGDRTLWQVLRSQDRFADALTILRDLRNQTDFLRPYDLIARILTRHRGRRLLIGRLGDEAEDGINALLAQALVYEQGAVPSLTGFLQWAQTDDLVIKRPLDHMADQVRVMTVHGSKGLEAPIVILPDCAKPRTELRGTLLSDAHGPVWKLTSDDQPPRQSAAVADAKAAEARERDRLLYVALTRAEKWLVIGAVDDLGKDGASWYDKARAGLDRCGASDHRFDFGAWGADSGWRLANRDWSELALSEPAKDPIVAPALPDWADAPAPAPQPRLKTQSPSELGGAKALAGADGDTEDIAKARGTAIHTMLEHLAPVPDTDRDQAAAGLLDDLVRRDDVLGAADLMPAILAEAMSVLRAPHLASCFAPDTLAEVPISADLPGLGRIHGIIDRLIVTPDVITAVDFKSNRVLPGAPAQVPTAILRQMGAYAAALAQLWPDRRIDTAIVWTRDASLMALPHEIVTEAWVHATTS